MKKNLEEYKNIHLIGIGGASMYSIAAMLKNDGKNVTGSDMSTSDNITYLEKLGIKITIGHNTNNLKDVDLVIYSAAIGDDDEELLYGRNNNIETIERAIFLGEYTKAYENLICISGTHGKSTTTAMISSIFLEANLEPTIQIGASLQKIQGNYYIGDKKYFILEACEYVDSFLHFNPTDAIVLNIDNDHLDYFKNLDNIKDSFKKFTSKVPKNGNLILNIDDINTKYLLNNDSNIITYGIENKKAIVQARNIIFNDLVFPSFDVFYNNSFFENITLKVLGKHNILNALAAISLSISYKIDAICIKNALEEFRGVGRRFEYLGEYKGAYLFDDFAHHPTEIMATYNSAKSIKHNESWAIFQSHTFSRTYEHMEEFADILAKFDYIIICDIYPAREKNIWNVKEDTLVNLINTKNKNVIHISSYEEIATYLKEKIKQNDLVITIGAGPINKVAKILLEK